jgi:hypothetical protein
MITVKPTPSKKTTFARQTLLLFSGLLFSGLLLGGCAPSLQGDWVMISAVVEKPFNPADTHTVTTTPVKIGGQTFRYEGKLNIEGENFTLTLNVYRNDQVDEQHTLKYAGTYEDEEGKRILFRPQDSETIIFVYTIKDGILSLTQGTGKIKSIEFKHP